MEAAKIYYEEKRVRATMQKRRAPSRWATNKHLKDTQERSESLVVARATHCCSRSPSLIYVCENGVVQPEVHDAEGSGRNQPAAITRV